MRRTMKRYLTTCIAAAVALVASTAAAAVPGVITHQGRLYATDGTPVKETMDVEFSIYDTPDAVVPIWTETHTITFDEGYFSVGLGEIAPFDEVVFDGSARYLGIKVGSDAEMTPRARVASVPYALLANDVNGDINPSSVNIQGFGTVIDENGKWVGDPTDLIGPPGMPGAAGATGPQGPAGTNGATGPQGPVGANGAIGPVGPQGPVGALGPVGPQGPVGALGPVGPQGPAGALGPVGPAGAMGPVGPAGAVGPQGLPGADGAIGPQGPQGLAGADGAIGPQGPQGLTGADGAIGPQGPQGLTGADGAIGPMGPQGLTGADGAIGPQGPQGLTGADGAIGATGPQGLTGATGAQGLQGLMGATGAQGPQGLTGATGAQGLQGLMGATGAQGPQGLAGAAGAQGPQGVSGVISMNYSAGTAPNPAVALAYLSITVTVTIAAGQKVHVTANRAFGALGAAANALNLYICTQATGGGALTTHNFGAFGMTAAANSRHLYGLSAAPILAPGTYTVGLCGSSTSANWINNEWSYVSTIVATSN